MPVFQDTFFDRDESATMPLLPELTKYHGRRDCVTSHTGSESFSVLICVTFSFGPREGLFETEEDEEENMVGLCQGQERVSFVVYYSHITFSQFWGCWSYTDEALPARLYGYDEVSASEKIELTWRLN